MKKFKKFNLKSIEKIADNLIIPKSVYGDVVEIALEDNTRMYINSHSGLICADENLIIFKCAGKFNVQISGTDLCLNAISVDRAFITGNIAQISF
jgi:sporulation protein YqfC